MLWSERIKAPAFWSLLSACQEEPYLTIWHGATARYSMICFQPFLRFIAQNAQYTLNDASIQLNSPWAWMRATCQRFSLSQTVAESPMQLGMMGYWGYEFASLLAPCEDMPAADPSPLPDCVLYAYSHGMVYDHAQQTLILMATGWPETAPKARAENAQSQLAALKQVVERQKALGALPDRFVSSVQSNFNADTYPAAVRELQAAILRGDLFQANLTQQFRATFKAPSLPNVAEERGGESGALEGADLARKAPLALFYRLCQHNPAPFLVLMAIAGLPGGWLLASSPERFVSLRGDEVTAEPIKGTCARAPDPKTDYQLKAALAASPKNRAENIMIVDLMRNDLSKVCLPGTVQVPTLCEVQSFATVHHLVSRVTGQLKPGLGAIAVLEATFPPGSVTGAPKLKAMEWIQQLEGRPRGPYCGCMGYITYQGEMETLVTIRTLVLQGDTVTWGAGGAVVLGSNSDQEYQESCLKGQRLRAILEGAL